MQYLFLMLSVISLTSFLWVIAQMVYLGHLGLEKLKLQNCWTTTVLTIGIATLGLATTLERILK